MAPSSGKAAQPQPAGSSEGGASALESPPSKVETIDPYALTTCKIPGVSFSPPPVPPEIELPPGLTLLGGYRGIGYQFYSCSHPPLPDGTPDLDAPASFRIRLDRIAAATLYGDECTIVGTLDFLSLVQRGARNTWTDGSQWFGRRVFELLPEGAPLGIPWLLLSKIQSTDDGFLSQVTYMHRLETIGGVPPQGECDPEESSGGFVIPFEATYYMYTGPPADAGAPDAAP